MHRRRTMRAASLTLALALIATLVPGTPVAATDTPGAVSATTTEVTLITGDRITVLPPAGGGQHTITVDPAARDGYAATFDAYVDGLHTYVLPSDAAPLVPEVLDRELFNVTRLVEYGYTDGTPVITTFPAGRAVASPAAAPGLSVAAPLPSINGAAATIDATGDWWRTTRGGDRRGTAAALAGGGSLPGVERVWLDRRVEAVLQESVPQIGAPAAWDAGFDGSGVTVAVLDTGVDADHPDLVGTVVAAENFTTSDTTGDRYGHGTHVAGIVTSSGAASDGAHVGVAPGAELLNGKVLNDFGFGQQSWIIAGMEWAAAQGADVINMSLGGDPSDGTDPISTALNQLSEQHDVLFVVAAGNSGPASQTVAAPAAADAALAVGNVTKDEELNILSSRGPRLADAAVKPEVTAPGTGIVAARSSEGTLPPPAEPVDDHYIRASGTSMAAPHVAGAAALLLQQRPDLSAADLKAALVGTAAPHPELTVFEQGAGRVDVRRAISTGLHAAPASLTFGVFAHPHEDAEPAHRQVTYTNLGDDPVTVELDVPVSGPAGAPTDPAMVTVAPARLTLAPGETGTATVTVDVTRGDIGVHAGHLVAEVAGDAVTRTPLSLHKEEELHELTVIGTARDGRPAAVNSHVDVVNLDGAAPVAEYNLFFQDGQVSLRLPPGEYAVMGLIETYHGTDVTAHETVFVGVPDLSLDRDTTVRLDARTAVEITVDAAAHDDATPRRVTLGYLRRGDDSVISKLALRTEWNRFFAVPTAPARTGEFEFFTHWRLGEPVVALDAGVELAYPPVLFPDSVPLDADLERPLVDAGQGGVDDYRDLDAEGAIVLVRRGGPSFTEKGANAAAAGAAALLVANDRPGQVPAFGIGADATMPAARLSQQDGDALQSLLADGDATVRLWGSRNTDYLYEAVLPETGGVPDQLAYQLADAGLATVDNDFHSDVAALEATEYREVFRPWQGTSVVFVNDLVAPSRRVEYLVPGDTRYRQRVTMPGGQMQEYLTRYEPGESRARSWWRQVAAPGVREGSAWEAGRPAVRDGDTLELMLAEWRDAAGNWGGTGAADTTAFRVYADGELVTETDRPRGAFPMRDTAAEYRLELEVDRDAGWWQTSTATRTAWTFQSAPSDDTEVVPLLLVDYAADVDLTNTAPHPRDRRGPATVELHVRHQPGAESTGIGGARLWVSYDDGGTWRERTGRAQGDGRYEYILDSRAVGGTGHVSLRVEAWDDDGNRIEQEVVRAWRLAER